jgi:hypothetical protein
MRRRSSSISSSCGVIAPASWTISSRSTEPSTSSAPNHWATWAISAEIMIQ